MEIIDIKNTLTKLKGDFERVAEKNSFNAFTGFFLSEEDKAIRTNAAIKAKQDASELESILFTFKYDETRAAENLVALKGHFDPETNKAVENIIDNFPQSIKDHFNGLREKEMKKIAAAEAQKSFDTSFNELLETVKTADITKAEEQFEKIKTSPLYGRFEKDRLIEQSLEIDSLPMLSLFHDIKKDPNYIISTTKTDKIERMMLSRSLVPRSSLIRSLLYTAIEQKAYRTALSLLLNDETNIDQGYHYGYPRRRSDGGYEAAFKNITPLEAAKESGMPSVINALTERHAQRLEKQAQDLRKTIQPPV